MIRIRNAVKKDIPQIMTFIREHWNENHIFANNRAFFEHEYSRSDDEEEINFIIAEDEQNEKIYGIEGYILMNHEERPDIAGTMWRALPCEYFMLGMKMREFMIESLNARLLCSPGINMKTNGIVSQYLGYHVDRLNHYYRLNDLESYQIAKVKNKKIPKIASSEYRLRKIEDFSEVTNILDDQLLRQKKPYKDLEYLNRRYFSHPIYHYDLYAVQNDKDESNSILIIREVEHKGYKAGKIIDFLGKDEDLAFISQSLDELAKKREYEYIDFYCYGIERDILEQAGFTLRDKDDENIIPNYFEPFLQENIEIYFLCNSTSDVYVYRGDGDQDRPSK